MIEIKQIPGYKLNPNDRVVNAILKRCEINDGLCPCVHTTGDYEGKDLHCPCSDYIKFGKCVCGLYVSEDSEFYFKSSEHLPSSANKIIDEYVGKNVTYLNGRGESNIGTLLALEVSYAHNDFYLVFKTDDKIVYKLLSDTKFI